MSNLPSLLEKLKWIEKENIWLVDILHSHYERETIGTEKKVKTECQGITFFIYYK